MKKLAFIFTLLYLASCSSDSENLTGEEYRKLFPKYEAVLTHIKPFVSSIADEYRLEISKTPEGYFLLLLSNEHLGKVKKEIKIWDFSTRKFLDLHYLKKAGFSNQGALNQLSSLMKSNKESFDLMLFFGYPQWAKDTRLLLEKQEVKSLWELEVLSRTYSHEASIHLFPGQTREHFEYGKDFQPVNYGEVSAEAKNEFIKLSEKSLDCLYEIEKRDPRYETYKIEDIQLKINHDLMYNYLSMITVKDEAAAKKYLERVHYPEWMLKIARQYLEECAPDAFFFCYGDGDTFPAMYMQAFKNFRTDVKVINLSLLQTAHYNQMICDLLDLKSPFSYEQFPKIASFYIGSWDGEIKNIAEMNDALIALGTHGKHGYDYVNLKSPFAIEIFGKEKEINYSGYQNDLSDAVLLNLMKDYPQGEFHSSSPIAFQNLGFISGQESFGVTWQFAGLTQKLSEDPVDKEKISQNLLRLTSFSKKTLIEMRNHGDNVLREIQNFYHSLQTEDRLKYRSLFELTRQKYDAAGFLRSGDIEKFVFVSQLSDQPSLVKMETPLKKWIDDLPLDYSSFESSINKIQHLLWICGSTSTEWSQNDYKASQRILSHLNQKLLKVKNDGSLKAYFWTAEALDKMIMGIDQSRKYLGN